YPEEKTDLTLSLIFPQGGNVVASIPEYNNGWYFRVDASGLIDDYYDYLFYESHQPDVWQLKKGWVVKREDLKDFFVDNMIDYEIHRQKKHIIESVIKYDG